MNISTAALLDKAKAMHHLRSDYKLALVMGVSHGSLRSYRQEITLPDAGVVTKICALTDDDPALIALEFEAARARTPEARQLWVSIAQRLQSGFADVQMLVFLAIGSIAAYALLHWAILYFLANTVFQSVYYVKSKLTKRPRPMPWYLVHM